MPKLCWHEDEELELIRLWNQEPYLSTAEIGSIMGKNKNKVVGKAHRLGLGKRKTGPGGRRAVARPETILAKKQHRIRPPKLVKPMAVSVAGGVHILDLTHEHCRGIVGYGPDGLARYCGVPVGTRPQRRRGELLRDPSTGQPMERLLAWCDGHAAIYLQE